MPEGGIEYLLVRTYKKMKWLCPSVKLPWHLCACAVWLLCLQGHCGFSGKVTCPEVTAGGTRRRGHPSSQLLACPLLRELLGILAGFFARPMWQLLICSWPKGAALHLEGHIHATHLCGILIWNFNIQKSHPSVFPSGLGKRSLLGS